MAIVCPPEDARLTAVVKLLVVQVPLPEVISKPAWTSVRVAELLNQQIVIENRAGAASNMAAEAVIKSPPDGYTLFMVGPNNAINASLYDKLNFDFVRDFAPVAKNVTGRALPCGHFVPEEAPARTLAEIKRFLAKHERAAQ